MAYARTRSILRKADLDLNKDIKVVELDDKERALIKQIISFPQVIQDAGSEFSPALIANYTYDLVKEFNSFYQNVPILGADSDNAKIFRVQLSRKVAYVIKNAFALLGIDVPERM